MRESLLRAASVVLLLLALQHLGAAGLTWGKAWLAPVLVEGAWQRSLAGDGRPVRPWPWADTWPVARLTFPRLGVSRLVLTGDAGSVLAFGPGHSRASAPLSGGGEVVISGHRDTHFHFLRRVRTGDELVLQLPDAKSRRYRVQSIDVVDSSRERLRRGRGADSLRLVTCYPFNAVTSGGPLRFVVTAVPGAGTAPDLFPGQPVAQRIPL